MKIRISVIMLSFLFPLNSSYAKDAEMEELLSMNLEQLMDINVSVATKSEKPFFTTAAPVFIISADDIRRSGSANIPEALRMAPGLQVSQINPHDWAVSIRGFNDQFANKLLVLVDGRSVYSNFTSGTYWRDLQTMPIESIERIEIIRGPGSTVWGANAVNGVINIITRSALTTKDAQLTAGGGSAQQVFGRFDYTQKITDNASVRGYGTYSNVADAKGLRNSKSNGGSGWINGARFDWDNKHNDKVMLDTNFGENRLEDTAVVTTLKPPYTNTMNSEPFITQNGHLLTRWEHKISEKNSWALSAYYDYSRRADNILPMTQHTFDVDFTHYFSLGNRNNLTWGTGYKRMNSAITNTVMLAVNPTIDSNDIYNLFVQDEIALDEDKRWLFTLGSKVEHYSITRFEVEPSGSLSWRINQDHTLWTSVSHAVRTPSRSQRDITALLFDSLYNSGTAQIPVMVQGKGKLGIDAENETAYQIGWRGIFNTDLTMDATAFYARYNDITRIETAGEPAMSGSLGFPAIIVPVRVGNNEHAQTFGAELSLNWQTTEWWRNYLSYSFLNVNSQPYAGHKLIAPDSDEKTAPEHQISLRTNFDVTHDIDLDLWGRYTDSIVTNGRAIDGYFNTDARIAWRPVKGLELSLIGQNLIQTNHIEWQGDFIMPQTNYVSRGIYAKFNWQFL